MVVLLIRSIPIAYDSPLLPSVVVTRLNVLDEFFDSYSRLLENSV